MTIRRTLLAVLLVVGLGPAIILAGVAFVKAREALRGEIDRNLVVQAVGVGAAIDKMMFERLQNAATWSRLDVMQDLQVRDVDKRLSRFLGDLKSGYGNVYLNLSGTDATGRVVSSSDPHLVGQRIANRGAWISVVLGDAQVDIENPENPDASGVVMRVPLVSAFMPAHLGTLRLQLDWASIDQVLDQASGGGDRMLAVLDREGRTIAASQSLRTQGVLRTMVLAGWRGVPGTAALHDGRPILATEAIVGTALPRGHAAAADLGWTTLIIQPVDRALAPVQRMAALFVLLIGISIGATALIATWLSREIARPIGALTLGVRNYMRSRTLAAIPRAGGGEVGELTEAFMQLFHDMDRSQRELIRASQMAAVGEMSAIIAHEIRTPLGILRSSAQLLEREAGVGAEGRELLGFIKSETERLNGLASVMLDGARPRAPSFQRVDLHRTVRVVMAMLAAQAAQRQVRMNCALGATDPWVDCDEEQVTQVLLNVLTNGLQILEPGGRIDTRTHVDGADMVLEIADDGPGIAPLERSRVFEAFFCRREGGIGLGLAIVQQLVLAHAGEIEAVGSPLGGALFRIRLPRRRAPAA